MRSANLQGEPINASSRADIAFLLLIFFLVSTTIVQEKGLMMKLPPKPEKTTVANVHERNLFKIGINAQNRFLVEDVVRHDLTGLKDEIKVFVLNYGADPGLSENPSKAIVSLKANRGARYKDFIAVLDEVKEAYYEIYGSRVGLTADEYRNLDQRSAVQLEIYNRGKEGIPMNISIAEPDKVSL